jgi:hypothetical protein
MKIMEPLQITPRSYRQLLDQPFSQVIGMIEVFNPADAVVLTPVDSGMAQAQSWPGADPPAGAPL